MMSLEKKYESEGWVSPDAVHPGEILADFLEDAGIMQAELADRIDLAKETINEIVKGKNPITADTAYGLSKVFGTTADFWMNFQDRYNADIARFEETERLHSEAKNYFGKFYRETYKELQRLGLVQVLPRLTEKEFPLATLVLQKYFGVGSLGQVPQVFATSAFRRYERQNVNQYTLAAWVRYGVLRARELDCEVYDKQKLKSILPELRRLSVEQNIPHALKGLQEMLGSCGVALVLAPKMKNTHAQGVAKWLASDKALIVVQADNQYEDRFWFNVFHELGHILLHPKRQIFMDFDKNIDSDQEKEANDFAQKILIPDYENVIDLIKKASDLGAGIEQAAKKIGVAPSIIAGRIAHEINEGRAYAILNKFCKNRIDYQLLQG